MNFQYFLLCVIKNKFPVGLTSGSLEMLKKYKDLNDDCGTFGYYASLLGYKVNNVNCYSCTLSIISHKTQNVVLSEGGNFFEEDMLDIYTFMTLPLKAFVPFDIHVLYCRGNLGNNDDIENLSTLWIKEIKKNDKV